MLKVGTPHTTPRPFAWVFFFHCRPPPVGGKDVPLANNDYRTAEVDRNTRNRARVSRKRRRSEQRLDLEEQRDDQEQTFNTICNLIAENGCLGIE